MHPVLAIILGAMFPKFACHATCSVSVLEPNVIVEFFHAGSYSTNNPDGIHMDHTSMSIACRPHRIPIAGPVASKSEAFVFYAVGSNRQPHELRSDGLVILTSVAQLQVFNLASRRASIVFIGVTVIALLFGLPEHSTIAALRASAIACHVFLSVQIQQIMAGQQLTQHTNAVRACAAESRVRADYTANEFLRCSVDGVLGGVRCRRAGKFVLKHLASVCALSSFSPSDACGNSTYDTDVIGGSVAWLKDLDIIRACRFPRLTYSTKILTKSQFL